MNLERVDPGTVALEKQMEASSSPTSRAPSVRRKSRPLSSEGVNPPEMDFKETRMPSPRRSWSWRSPGESASPSNAAWRASLSWRTSSLTWVLPCGYAGQPWPSRSAWSPSRRGSL